MKRFAVGIMMVAALMLTSCHGSNEYGECIGLIDEDAEDPNMKYKIDLWNTVWSFIGIETIIAPVLWVTHFARCPVGPKKGS